MRFRFLVGLVVLALISVGCGSDGTDTATALPDAITLSSDDPDAPLAITFGGFFYADDTGARLCAGFAESFPPQCFDEIVMIEAPIEQVLDEVRTALGDPDVDPINNESTVWWTDDWVTLSGTLQANRLVLD